MEDTMQKTELALLESGALATLSDVRSKYQDAMRDELCHGVERLTGRKVVAFISGNNIDPDISSELFLLDGPPRSSRDPEVPPPTPAAKLVRKVD
jgi:uncharacterized protein YbcI